MLPIIEVIFLVWVCYLPKRVFSVGAHAVTTYNPSTLEVTNQVILIEVVESSHESLKFSQDFSKVRSESCFLHV